MQIESICADGYSEESLLCALEELPLSLHETYNQSVNKIKGQVSKLAELAGRALLCLAFSQRPLSYEELMELVTYLDRRETNAYAAAKWSADVVLGACHNFLISDAGKFSFIHVSARQYVRRFWNRLYDSKLEGEEGANALLAQACLRYAALSLSFIFKRTW
jgi:hypothetical protein